MRLSCQGFRGNVLAALAWSVVACLPGCSEDPGLQERVNRLQAELQEKDRQFQESQSLLEKTRSDLKSARAVANKPPAAANPPSTPPFLPKEQVDEGYTAASKEMRRLVTGELKSYAVEDCIEYPVVMPTDARPYRSKVVLLVRSDAGRSYRLEFPVSADVSGKWVFPTASEVAGALAESRTQDSNSSATTNTPGPGAAPRNTDRPPTVPGQNSNETRVIDWGDGRSTNAGNRPTPAPNGVSPAPGRSPMPADKDIKIHW